MNRHRWSLVIAGLTAVAVWGATARLEAAPDVGAPPALVKKKEIIAEIQAAFTAWELACTDLKFKYAGELTDFAKDKKGAILVYFGYDTATWGNVGNDVAYFTSVDIELVDTGEIAKGVIALNAQKYSWAIGKQASAIDIRTAVQHMIPGTIGFYVGSDTAGNSLPTFVKYDFVDHTLLPLHKLGAQVVYFKADPGCTQPGQPPVCGKGTGWTMDAGPREAGAKDAGAKEAGSKEAGSKEAGSKEGGAAKDAAAKDAAAKDAPKATDATAGKEQAAKDVLKAPDAELPNRLCHFNTRPADPAKGIAYHWAKRPIEYYVYLNGTYGKVPGGIDAPVPPSPPEFGNVKKDTGTGGGAGGDSGCCRVAHTRADEGGAAGLLLLGLALLLVVAHRRRRSS